jgi:hypothetical protein
MDPRPLRRPHRGEPPVRPYRRALDHLPIPSNRHHAAWYMVPPRKLDRATDRHRAPAAASAGDHLQIRFIRSGRGSRPRRSGTWLIAGRSDSVAAFGSPAVRSPIAQGPSHGRTRPARGCRLRSSRRPATPRPSGAMHRRTPRVLVAGVASDVHRFAESPDATIRCISCMLGQNRLFSPKASTTPHRRQASIALAASWRVNASGFSQNTGFRASATAMI